MQAVIAGQSNIVCYDVTARATGNPITTGTVTFYLLAITGTNAGKWFRASDSSWQISESSAGAGIYVAAAQWQCTIAAAAWEYGVSYFIYAKESEDLNIIYTEQVIPSLTIGAIGSGNIRWVYTLTNATTGLPIGNAHIWVTTDIAGENVVYKDETNASGQVVFYLAAGTYYVWRSKTGYTFENPDEEYVA